MINQVITHSGDELNLISSDCQVLHWYNWLVLVVFRTCSFIMNDNLLRKAIVFIFLCYQYSVSPRLNDAFLSLIFLLFIEPSSVAAIIVYTRFDTTDTINCNVRELTLDLR